MRLAYWPSRAPWPGFAEETRAHVVLATAAAILVLHLTEIGLYTGVIALATYALHLGRLVGDVDGSHLELLYFSAETYTSLGFGDIIPRADAADRQLRAAERADPARLVGLVPHSRSPRYWRTAGRPLRASGAVYWIVRGPRTVAAGSPGPCRRPTIASRRRSVANGKHVHGGGRRRGTGPTHSPARPVARRPADPSTPALAARTAAPSHDRLRHRGGPLLLAPALPLATRACASSNSTVSWSFSLIVLITGIEGLRGDAMEALVPGMKNVLPQGAAFRPRRDARGQYRRGCGPGGNDRCSGSTRR